jgi:transposase
LARQKQDPFKQHRDNGRQANIWLNDARKCGIYGVRRFARTLRQDIGAGRNAVLEPWTNGQTEGQINRLKMIKRAMYGRAGVDLLQARMMPLRGATWH